MEKKLPYITLLLLNLFFTINLIIAQTPPIKWVAPESFDSQKPGLGLTQLAGVNHKIIFDPIPSFGAIESGGSGHYESVLHGTYNHHTQALYLENKVLVYWTNHSNDENGPAERILARWGMLNKAKTDIDWGEPSQLIFELAPAIVPLHRRIPLNAQGFDRRYVVGRVTSVNNQLRLDANIQLNQGWTDDPKYRMRKIGEPVPDVHYRFAPDNDEKYGYGLIYHYDMFWTLGYFHQLWQFKDGKFVPATPIYLDKPQPTSFNLTDTKSYQLSPMLPPYSDAKILNTAPMSIQQLIRSNPDKIKSRPYSFAGSKDTIQGMPYYEPGTEILAVDGKNSLAHRAEFRRPDGKWVIIRDNLINPGHYYAAESISGKPYPPAIQTNMVGDAMPAAGELPDGRVWIIGNNAARTDFYIMLSNDGITFDRTWLLLHIDHQWTEGFAKNAFGGGPQYPFTLQFGDAIWLFYSIGKQQIGVTRIPYSSLK